VSDAMEAEFGTVAEWTAQMAVELGPEYHVPAACRGSGSPVALDWLVEGMGLRADEVLLDCGAGVGGPAAYAARACSVRPLLVDPEAGACRAARTLFPHPVVQAAGAALPMADASVDAAWALGVLCTTPEQVTLLRELRRAVRPGGPIGLLVFVAHGRIPSDRLGDNHFPTPAELVDLVHRAALDVEQSVSTADLAELPATWNARVETVTNALTERHGRTRAWELAERQSSAIGDLLDDGTLTGELVVLRSR
jgi:ubiquinone/menaquinone biosynthesis C-methylase UbiE